MMKKIKKQVLACRLEIHWWLIMWYRKRMTKLFSCGEPLSSPRMLQLNNKAGRHHVFIKLQGVAVQISFTNTSFQKQRPMLTH